MAGQYFNSFDKAKIYYEKNKGDTNKWLIFLHGFGGDLTAWNNTRNYFHDLGISTIALDLRGHGLSDRRNDKNFYKFENFAKDVSLLLAKEGILNPVIIGHCFGGMVSIYYEAQFPNSSRGLVLVDTSYKPPFFSSNFVTKAFFDRMINLFIKIMPDIKKVGRADYSKFVGSSDLNPRRILTDILHTSLKTYLQISKQLVKLDAKKLLDKILVPTLVIEGENDSIFPPNIARSLSKRIKNSQLDLIEGANHIIVLNNPKELGEAIEEFLKKIKFI